MIHGFVRLFQIFVAVILVGVLVIFGLRSLGQNDQYSSPFDDVFFTRKQWLIVMPNWQKPDLGPALKALPEMAILGADVQILQDGELIVFPDHFFKTGDTTTFLAQLTLTEFKEFHPDVITLKEFLEFSGSRPVFIRANHLNRMNSNAFSELLKKNKTAGPLVIQVANQSLKKRLKEIEPLWIFANTPSEFGRLKMFASMGLESVVSLDADVYVLDKFVENVVTEVQRRKRKALVFETALPFQNAADSLDGIIVTSRPENIPTDLLRRVDPK